MKKNSIFIISILLMILDQAFKFLVKSNMKLFESISVIPHFFQLTYIKNKGAAWGIFSDATIFLVLISLVAFFLLVKFIWEEKNWNLIKVCSFGFIIGGMMGNLIDRIIYHAVIDYLDFNIFGYHFPVFNFADTMIVIGGILIIIEMIRSEVYERQSRKN